MEEAAVELSRKGRGFFGRRERRVEGEVVAFVDQSKGVSLSGVLPIDVREALQTSIDRTIDALEVHVARHGTRSNSRTRHDSSVVLQIYALREVQQHLMRSDPV